MEQLSEMTIRPFDYKFNPAETELKDIVHDLDLPEKHGSQQYVPVSIIKIIYNSMNAIHKKLTKLEEEVNLNKISKKISRIQKDLDQKSKQIEDINQTFIARNRKYQSQMVLRK